MEYMSGMIHADNTAYSLQANGNMSKEELNLLFALRKPIEFADYSYSSRNSSKGALLAEAKTLFSYLAENDSMDSARRAVLQEDLLAKKAYQTRKRCWAILHARYFPGRENSVANHPILSLFQDHTSETMKRGVLYYHYAISDLFSYEVTVELVYDLYRRGLTNIAPRDIHAFLDSKAMTHPEINKWSPQTRSSLVSHYLSAMRDFGILEGKVRKKIHRPTVEDDLFLYIITYLKDCGKSPREIVTSIDFRLFLLSPDEVEAKLIKAQQNNRIHFKKSGRIISLELPWRSIHEYIKDIGQ